jgi:7-keto-8-aminopelargonate synthetase-like enzyme
MDVFQKCVEMAGRVEPIRAAGIYPYYRVIASAQEPVVQHDGRELIMLGSNNYLGLTNHPEVKEAAAMALALYGTGCAGSRLLTVAAAMKALELVEREPERRKRLWEHTKYMLHELQGLGFGRTHKFRHNDMGHLEQKLAAATEERGKLVIVDGVFSMEGDLAPLPSIVELKNRYDARLLVDDAHGLGVFGENGRGTPEHFGVEDQVDLVMGTFSKSLATVGGFVAGDRYVIDHIKHHARSEIFSAAPPGGGRHEGAGAGRARAGAPQATLGAHQVHASRAAGARLRHRRLGLPGDPAGDR